MLKKLLIFALISALTVCSAGCSGKEDPVNDTTASQDAETTAPVIKMPVMDKDGTRLGEIDSRASCSAVDAGIFYGIFDPGMNNPTGIAEYHLYNKEDKTDVLLGKFEDQGYEAVYTRTELNGRIYTLAVQGKPGEDNVPLMLLSFDPEQKTMKTFTVSKNGFPYTDMAAVDGKLLIMNHEMSGLKKDTVYAFDPADETVKEVLSFSSATDSLRGLCTAENGFYLLRLKINDGGENEMFVDLYDNDFKKTSEFSVNEPMVKAIMNIHGIESRQDALNEIGMSISHFSVLDGRYMLYENFALARICVDLQTEETILAKEDLYTVSIGNGDPVVYRMGFEEDIDKDPEIIVIKNGKPENYSFKPTDTHKLVRNISKSEDGTWVVMTSDDYRNINWTLAVYLWTEK